MYHSVPEKLGGRQRLSMQSNVLLAPASMHSLNGHTQPVPQFLIIPESSLGLALGSWDTSPNFFKVLEKVSVDFFLKKRWQS